MDTKKASTKIAQKDVVIHVRQNIASSDSSMVLPGCNIILLCITANSNSSNLKHINKYHESCNDPKSHCIIPKLRKIRI